jgi:hypothetical protein
LVGAIKDFNPLRLNKFIVGPFRSHIPAPHPSKEALQLNSEKILKIWKKDQLNSEMIWKIWKKSKSNSETIGTIWKKIVK